MALMVIRFIDLIHLLEVAILLFSSPDLEDTFGMTYDGAHIWVTDHANSSNDPAYAMQFDFAGIFGSVRPS